MIPGVNLLNLAMQLIAPQAVVYFRFTGRALNANRDWVNTYAPGEPDEEGSVQAVDRRLYMQLGLDMQKDYVYWITPRDIRAVERERAPDAIEWDGRRYQCEAITRWQAQDGWTRALCVDVGEASA